MVKLTPMDASELALYRDRNGLILVEMVKLKNEYSELGKRIRALEKERHDILVKIAGA